MTDPFTKLVGALASDGVQFVVMGVWGANYYARSPAGVVSTQDRDLFLPPNPENLLRAWKACSREGLELWSQLEPLDLPRDLFLAQRVVAVRAVTQATDGRDLQVDFSLVMGSFRFEDVWDRRRVFLVDGVEVPVASLVDIVASKEQVDRPKDRLFLATLKEELRQVLEAEKDPGGSKTP